MIKKLLLALALLAAPAAPAMAQQPVEEAAELRAHREFAQWIQRVSSALERAAVVNGIFESFMQGYDPNESHEVTMTRLSPLRQQASEAQIALANLQVEIGEIERFENPALPPELEVVAESVLRDSGTYLRNMDQLLGTIIATIEALEREDVPALQRLGPRLLQSVSLLLDGQIVMIRARQQLMPPDGSGYHGLGAMAYMYEGMRALAMPNVPNRAHAITLAADAAASAGLSGRAALARERAELPEVASRERDILEQMADLEEQSFVVNDRVVATLRTAAVEARRGVGGDVLNARYTPQIAALEMEYLRLNQQQVNLYAELTEAGRDL